jgi:hypothetical protein
MKMALSVNGVVLIKNVEKKMEQTSYGSKIVFRGLLTFQSDFNTYVDLPFEMVSNSEKRTQTLEKWFMKNNSSFVVTGNLIGRNGSVAINITDAQFGSIKPQNGGNNYSNNNNYNNYNNNSNTNGYGNSNYNNQNNSYQSNNNGYTSNNTNNNTNNGFSNGFSSKPASQPIVTNNKKEEIAGASIPTNSNPWASLSNNNTQENNTETAKSTPVSNNPWASYGANLNDK